MSAAEHHVTAPEDRIPLRQKTAYAVGMFVNNLQAGALPAMMVILNLGLGMDPFLVGLIAAIPLTLMDSMLLSKSRRLIDVIEQQSIGIIAHHTEEHERHAAAA